MSYFSIAQRADLGIGECMYVYISDLKVILVLVEGQQLGHLVVHLFMNHWALSSLNTLASVLWELQQ